MKYKLNGIWRLLSRNLLVKHTHTHNGNLKKKESDELNENSFSK